MAKMLQCGKNQIAGPVPVHGFGMGLNKTKAMQAAMDMAHGFANLVATTRAAEFKCPTDKGCPKMKGPQVANEKTIELLTVKLQNNLYLSVVRGSFDIVIYCRRVVPPRATPTPRSTPAARPRPAPPPRP